MRYVGLKSTSDLQPRERVRVTWSRSLYGDFANWGTFGIRNEEDLTVRAHETLGRVPSTGVAFKVEGPNINAATDSFTADLQMVHNLPASGFSAANFAAVLDAIAARGITATVLQRVAPGTTYGERDAARDAANAGADDEAGAGAFFEKTADRLAELLSVTRTTVYILAGAAGVAAVAYLAPRRSAPAAASTRAPAPLSDAVRRAADGIGRGKIPARGPGGKFVKAS